MKKRFVIGAVLLFALGMASKSTVWASETEYIKMSDGSFNKVEEERGKICVTNAQGEEIVTAKKNEKLVALDVHGTAYQVGNKKERFFYKILDEKGELQETPDGRVAAWIVTSDVNGSNIKSEDAFSYQKKTDTLTIKNIRIDEMDIYVSNLYVAGTSHIDNIVSCNDVSLDIIMGNRLSCKTSSDLSLREKVKKVKNSTGCYYQKCCDLSKDVKTEIAFTGTTSWVYTGAAIQPALTVKADGKELKKGTDYTVSYVNNVNVGTAQAVISGIGDYTGAVKKEFRITQYSIANCTVDSLKNMVYGGSGLTQAVTVRHGSKILKNGSDYTLTWSNNVNVGTGRVTINGKGNYTGSKSAEFQITAYNISNCTIVPLKTMTYTGGTLSQAVTVKHGSRTLTGSDYTLTWSSNVNAGTGKVTVTGNRNYTGTKTAAFTIAKADINNAAFHFPTVEYDGKAKSPAPDSAKFGSRNLVNKTDYTIKYSNNVNAGTAKAVITGANNFCGTKTVNFTISKKAQNIVCASDSFGISYEKSATKDLGVTNKEGGGKLSYKSSATSVVTVNSSGIITVKGYGRATITVTAAAKGNYKETKKTISIRVIPKKPQISSVTSPSAGALKVQWKKVSGASGYIIKYATTSSLSNAKEVKVKDQNATNKTIKSLSKGQRYYVAVYAYRDVKGQSPLTSYKSNVENVVTKK